MSWWVVCYFRIRLWCIAFGLVWFECGLLPFNMVAVLGAWMLPSVLWVFLDCFALQFGVWWWVVGVFVGLNMGF